MNEYLDRVVANLSAGSDRLFCRSVSARGTIDISWSDLRADALRFVGAYRGAGLERGGTILIFLRHVRELYGSFLGAMLGGYTPSYMPCTSPRQDPNLYWKSHDLLMARIAPAAIVASAETFAEMEGAGLDLSAVRRIVVEDLAASGTRTAIPELVDGAAIGVLQHSSGTTGLKKGVALTYASLAAQVESYSRALRVDGGETIVSWLPLYHDMGFIACFIMPLYLGLPTVHIDPFWWLAEPQSLFRHASQNARALVWLPNFAFEHLTNACKRNAGDFALGDVKAFINCSEPCKARTFDRFAEAFAASGVEAGQLQCCYAMAEAVFAVTQTRIGAPVRRLRVNASALADGKIVLVEGADETGVELIECGAAIDEISVRVFDDEKRDLPEGQIGQIALAGRFLFAGYNKDPERTASRFAGDRYCTGDVGFLMDGRLYVLGRLDDMLIINGRNIFAHEVEASLAGVAGLKSGRGVAGSVFSERNGTANLIVIAEKIANSGRADADVVRDIINTLNSTYSVQPYKVQLVDEGWLIKTTSGKISREANMKKLMQQLESRT